MSASNALVLRADDRRVADARARLAQARQRTGRTLGALQIEVEAWGDWQTWYRLDPRPFLTAAFLVGFLLARRR